MRQLLGNLSGAFRFMGAGLTNLATNASLVPSSRFLVDAMADAAHVSDALQVVEYGPGSGGITQALLDRMRPDARLYCIELDEALLRATERRVHDPRLVPLHGSAADASRLVHDAGLVGQADVIVSSLGLSMMPDELRAAIYQDASQLLAPRGTLVQYLYPHGRLVTYQHGRGWARFDGEGFLSRYFADVKGRLVLPNLPPAVVFTCNGPRVRRVDSAARASRQERTRRRQRHPA